MLSSLFGTDLPPAASDALLILLLVLGVGAAVLLVMLDAVCIGPRHQAWRQSVLNRMRGTRRFERAPRSPLPGGRTSSWPLHRRRSSAATRSGVSS